MSFVHVEREGFYFWNRAQRRKLKPVLVSNMAIRESDRTYRRFWQRLQGITWLPCVATVPHFDPGRYCETQTKSGVALGGYR